MEDFPNNKTAQALTFGVLGFVVPSILVWWLLDGVAHTLQSDFINDRRFVQLWQGVGSLAIGGKLYGYHEDLKGKSPMNALRLQSFSVGAIAGGLFLAGSTFTHG